MTINQEDGGKIEDYYFSKVHKALHVVEEQATSIYLDTEILKALCSETLLILKDFEKYIIKVEQDQEKKLKKEKVKALLNRTDFD